jgi:hypothetical protein
LWARWVTGLFQRAPRPRLHDSDQGWRTSSGSRRAAPHRRQRLRRRWRVRDRHGSPHVLRTDSPTCSVSLGGARPNLTAGIVTRRWWSVSATSGNGKSRESAEEMLEPRRPGVAFGSARTCIHESCSGSPTSPSPSSSVRWTAGCEHGVRRSCRQQSPLVRLVQPRASMS